MEGAPRFRAAGKRVIAARLDEARRVAIDFRRAIKKAGQRRKQDD